MKTIIYYRKSTDRDDKQANSLEHQLNNCRKTAELHNLEIYKEFWESKSAKTEFKREMFNEMIRLCKLKKVDYIICDEPKRLSRNNLDTSRIVDLLDKKEIKWIIWTSREYHGENSRDKFLLQLDLSFSKMDNEDRAKDTKDKMITAFKKWSWMGKAPIWYKNVVIRKGHHEVHINEDIAPIIKKWFYLRVEWYSYTKIADYFYEQWIHTASGRKFAVERVKHILNNKFYMWIMSWNNLEAKWKHKPLITEDIFYKATEHNKTSTITNKKRVYKLAGILKDYDRISLPGYTKKGNVYYHNQSRSNYKISISEKIVFNKFWEILKDFKLPNPLPQITLDMLEEIFHKVEEKQNIDTQKVTMEIERLTRKKDILLDSFLDGDIEKTIYKSKLSEIELKIVELNKKLQAPSKVTKEKLKKVKKYSELFIDLYQTEKLINVDEKLNILKSLKSELFTNTKKELHIAENRLMQLLKKLVFLNWQSNKKNNHTYKQMKLFIEHMINIYEKYKYIIQNINFRKL